MEISSSTIGGSFVLWIIFSILLVFIFSTTSPDFLLKEDDKDEEKISYVKTIFLSLFLSLVFTSMITFISITVDEQNSKHKI